MDERPLQGCAFMSSREATDTITGYFYQFDKTILELLQQEQPDTSVCIEGIEDIDIVHADETSAIQCKYYAKTEYNHSVLKKPIKLMLTHFSENREAGVKYHLYGHYKSGHEKFSPLSCDSLKLNFLTYKKKEKDAEGNESWITHYVHAELGLTDHDLEEFLARLTVDINAPSIEEQYEQIIGCISEALNVSTSEAEMYHYNSALKIIKNLSITQSLNERYVTKSEFLKLISEKDEVFDAWFIKRKGREKYIKSIKKEYLSSGLNLEAFNRFFLIDCYPNEEIHTLQEAILLLAKKWSKISKRQKPCFCPSIYLNGIEEDKLIELKNLIYSKGVIFRDPYPFKNSTLSSEHFYSAPSLENKVQFRFVDSLTDLDILIGKSGSTVELYQFYRDEVYFNNTRNKHVKIKIEDISYIKDLTK